MELSQYPVIDWELGLKLAGNNQELAKELLEMLTSNLSNDIQKIKNSYEKKNYNDLGAELHKLHGAVSYCATPRLKKIVATLEKSVKQNNVEQLSELLDTLDIESRLVLGAMRDKFA